MRNINIYGFVTLYGILFLTILFKVIHVPVTTDEVPTVFFYSKFSFWEIMMYPDNIPNNHILNTILAKCCLFLFGKEQWAIRLPNLLSFFIFAYSVFRILKHVLKPNSYFFLPAAILFVNPYLLDFFGVCRGYGISSTLATLTVSLLISGFLQRKNSHIWLSLLTALLASYANFTLLVFWAATTILVWLYFIVVDKADLKKLMKITAVLFIISVAYLALILLPLQKIHSTNEFKYWTSGGFYKETVESLIFYWRYGSEILFKINSKIWAGLVGIVILTNILYVIKKLKKAKFTLASLSHPAFVVTAILLLPVFVNVIQTKLLGTPNLNGRAALFFFPLFSSAIAVFFSLIPKFKNQLLTKSLAILIGIICITNLTNRISLSSIKEWYYDQNTLEVINFLKENQTKEPISLKTSWFFHPSFYFYCDAGKAPWIDLQPYDYNIDITTPSEYYYIFAEDYKALEPKFEVVYKFSPERWLLKQKMR